MSIAVTVALSALVVIGLSFVMFLDKVEHQERLRRYRERELSKYF